MYERLKDAVLWLLKVPPEPHDPMGDVHSLRVFRAAPGYLLYMTIGWCLSQVMLLGGGIAAAVPTLLAGSYFELTPITAAIVLLALAVFVIQAVISYFTLRLHYEMRWYKVTDRSLRIRSGVWSVHEMTMTFANVQNITVTQGPLERLFGISDVRVQSAGGGSKSSHGEGEGMGKDLHVAVFRGVDNPEEIRTMMLQRLQKLRGTGLGDLDDRHDPAPAPSASAAFGSDSRIVALLAQLRDEAAALRKAAEAAA